MYTELSHLHQVKHHINHTSKSIQSHHSFQPLPSHQIKYTTPSIPHLHHHKIQTHHKINNNNSNTNIHSKNNVGRGFTTALRRQSRATGDEARLGGRT